LMNGIYKVSQIRLMDSDLTSGITNHFRDRIGEGSDNQRPGENQQGAETKKSRCLGDPNDQSLLRWRFAL